MKKITKRLLTLFMALLMVVSIGNVALAEEVKTKLSVADEGKGNTYSVFQVMTAKKIGQDQTGNLVYEYTLNQDFKDFFKNEVNGFKLTKNMEIQIKDASNWKTIGSDGRWQNTNTTDAAKLAAALEKYAVENNIAAIQTLKDDGEPKEFPIGYYLVAETGSGSDDQAEVASKPVLVNLVDNDTVEITPKKETVTLQKMIVEGADRVKENTANIGDDINYEIKTKFPKYKANANETIDKSKLMFKLTDTFSEGLTYNDDLSIAGYTKDTDYTVNVSGQILTITFKSDTILAHQGEEIVATYSAKLNAKAKVNGPNPNEITLDYTHNPNQADEHKTLKDKVKSFTFGFGVHKVDGADNSNLPNAEFELRRETEDGELVKFEKDSSGNYVVDKNGTVEKIVSVAGDAPIVKGLKPGVYYLIETKAPDHYTKVEPIKVVLTGSTVDGTSTINVSGGGDASGEQTTNGTKTNEVTSSEGIVDINVFVKNYKGISLPETGSKAAMYFMIAGLAIAAVGIAYYEVSRRKNAVK